MKAALKLSVGDRFMFGCLLVYNGIGKVYERRRRATMTENLLDKLNVLSDASSAFH